MFVILFVLSLFALMDVTVQSEEEYTDLGQQQGYFQGDIRINMKNRNAITKQYRWPEGKIYYTINQTNFNQDDIKLIKDGMKAIEKSTCIRFIERTNQLIYTEIVNEKGLGCASDLGMGTHKQGIFLEKPGCMTHATIVHELLHTIGLWHEQSRYDRDDYITINWDNLPKSDVIRMQYKMRTPEESQFYGIPYNYASVMHYNAWSASKDGASIVMQPKDPFMLTIMGNPPTANETDFEKVRRLYECKEKYEPIPPAPMPPCVDKWPDCNIQSDRCLTDGPTIQNCRKTCGFCEWGKQPTATPRPCMDYATDCDHAENMKMCSTDKEWRERKCAYTCGHCDKARTPYPMTPKPCVDQIDYCDQFQHECKKPESFTNYACRKTCELC